MEVASGEYGDHMARLVKAVQDQKCEKDYNTKMNADGTLNPFLWHRPCEEVHIQDCVACYRIRYCTFCLCCIFSQANIPLKLSLLNVICVAQ